MAKGYKQLAIYIQGAPRAKGYTQLAIYIQGAPRGINN